MKRFTSLFHPERFQGWGKKKRYFEGWYFKIINADETKAFAFIPGIAIDENGVKHAFIQVLNGKNQTSTYHSFNYNLFKASKNKFEIQIDKNYFSINTIILDLPDIKGELNFSEIKSWPKHWYSPGIMGPFSFVPFMECKHGIVNLNCKIEGGLTINGEHISFDQGKGYCEKDWGHSFPSAYFWMQSNHFSNPTVSIKASVAKIPWLGKSFVGFIAGILIENKLYHFTTYNHTKLLKSFADKNIVEIVLENKNYQLHIKAKRENQTQLAAPISGFMTGRIEESMTSYIEVVLTDRKTGLILFSDIGRNAGLEVAGNISEIFVN